MLLLVSGCVADSTGIGTLGSARRLLLLLLLLSDCCWRATVYRIPAVGVRTVSVAAVAAVVVAVVAVVRVAVAVRSVATFVDTGYQKVLYQQLLSHHPPPY